jgi:hypothetical protein
MRVQGARKMIAPIARLQAGTGVQAALIQYGTGVDALFEHPGRARRCELPS